MKILVTGGAGFIGSALANNLVHLGHRVRVIDDLSSGDPAGLDGAVSFTRGDVRDIPKLWTLLRDVEVVFHLAARVSVSESILYPVEYNEVNVGGTVSLMTAARDAGVRRVVLASSGTVYGEQAEQPVKESAPVRPPNPYAVSKIASEYYLSALGGLYEIEVVMLRIFNAYGPGQAVPPSHPPAIPHFIRQALSGSTPTIFGSGKQTRDFIYITDVVEALTTAGLVDNVNGLVINVGTGQEVSINDLLKKIENHLGRRVLSLHNPGQSGGVSRLVADTELAQKTLGFRAEVDIDEGLALLLKEQEKLAPSRLEDEP
ncbi:MAG TPA: NAD-dependent epimerase/dehydratase family protein [Chloroflexi bacterium]|nr:NAD-dependent epimerase/dehydratase family protein [Chloroflexota bacterium]